MYVWCHNFYRQTWYLETISPGKVFSKTNLSPKRKGNVGGNGFVFTWYPMKQMDKKTGPLRENQTPGHVTAWMSTSNWRRRDLDMIWLFEHNWFVVLAPVFCNEGASRSISSFFSFFLPVGFLSMSNRKCTRLTFSASRESDFAQLRYRYVGVNCQGLTHRYQIDRESYSENHTHIANSQTFVVRPSQSLYQSLQSPKICKALSSVSKSHFMLSALFFTVTCFDAGERERVGVCPWSIVARSHFLRLYSWRLLYSH